MPASQYSVVGVKQSNIMQRDVTDVKTLSSWESSEPEVRQNERINDSGSADQVLSQTPNVCKTLVGLKVFPIHVLSFFSQWIRK